MVVFLVQGILQLTFAFAGFLVVDDLDGRVLGDYQLADAWACRVVRRGLGLVGAGLQRRRRLIVESYDCGIQATAVFSHDVSRRIPQSHLLVTETAEILASYCGIVGCK